jgi:hypothetical protein
VEAPVVETPVVALAEYRARRSATARQKIADTFEPLLLDVGEVLVAREVNAATRALDKAFRARGVGDFDAWISEFYATYPEYATERSYRVIRAMSEAIHGEVAAELDAPDPTYRPEVADFVDAYTKKMGEREAASSVGQLRAILRDTPPEEVEAALRTRLVEWKEKRAKKFAARESTRAANATARESYMSLGVERLKWRASGACPLCHHMDGRTAEIRGAFLRKGETVDPGDGETEPMTTKQLIRHPPLHSGCRCTIVPA